MATMYSLKLSPRLLSSASKGKSVLTYDKKIKTVGFEIGIVFMNYNAFTFFIYTGRFSQNSFRDEDWHDPGYMKDSSGNIIRDFRYPFFLKQWSDAYADFTGQYDRIGLKYNKQPAKKNGLSFLPLAVFNSERYSICVKSPYFTPVSFSEIGTDFVAAQNLRIYTKMLRFELGLRINLKFFKRVDTYIIGAGIVGKSKIERHWKNRNLISRSNTYGFGYGYGGGLSLRIFDSHAISFEIQKKEITTENKEQDYVLLMIPYGSRGEKFLDKSNMRTEVKYTYIIDL